jgi:hypothetical protein
MSCLPAERARPARNERQVVSDPGQLTRNRATSRALAVGTRIEHERGMNLSHRLALLFFAGAGFLTTAACRSSFAFGAETPRMLSPSVDIEVEDKAPSSTAHTARFNVALSNGYAELDAIDGEARYALSVHTLSTTEPKLGLRVKRNDHTPGSEIGVSVAIPQQPGGRIVVARIDRADGHVTTVIAQAH